jgi:hypothetical protein
VPEADIPLSFDHLVGEAGTVRPSALAVLMLIISTYLVGAASGTRNIESSNPLHCAQHPACGRRSFLLCYIGVSDHEPTVAGDF